MILQDYSGLGYGYIMNVKGGHLIEGVNQAYKTPYQLKFKGMFVDKKLSSVMDSDATPTTMVVVPSVGTTGNRAYGWVYITTSEHHPLPGTPVAYLPLTEDLDSTDGDGIAYSSDFSKWAVTTVAPFQNGEAIGIPMAAGAKFVVGDEISPATGGFARKSTTNDVVHGIVEFEADNSTGAAGAKFAWVKVVPQYVK